MQFINRRSLLLGSAAALLAAPSGAEPPTAIHVVKGTGCECCDQWAIYLRDQGFAVTDEERYGTLLIRFKMDLGVPPAVYSCHTGMVEGYALEGHIPAADIHRLLEERPDAIGLAVPGMPYGSPGMGRESARQAYDVLLIRQDGTTEVFSSYPAA